MKKAAFSFCRKEDGIYLIINNPELNINEVLGYLNDRKLRYDVGRLTSDLVYRQSNEIKISDDVDIQIGEEQIVSLSIQVSPDKMLAFLTIEPTFPPELDEQNLLDFLAYHGIRHGIYKDKIRSLVKAAQPLHLFPIAAGTPPGKGLPGDIAYFHKLPVKSLKMDEKGRVNYYDINDHVYVKTGEIVAMKIAPAPGKAGKNVYGEKIPGLLGQEASFQIGRGIAIFDDKAVAVIDGTLIRDDKGRISVSRLFRLNTDVNFASGNIRFDGDVSIAGNVQPGFKVHAEGDIHIYGMVDNAEIISESGSIVVDGPILGRTQVSLRAYRDIRAQYIQNAVIEAGNNIYVEDYVTRCSLKAGNKIDISGGKGLVLGNNTLYSKNALIVKNITNPEEVEVTIEGFKPDDYRKRILDIDKKIAEGTNLLNKLAQEKMNYFQDDKSQDNHKKYNQVLGKTFHIEKRLELLYQEKLSLEDVLREVLGRGMVHILQGPVHMLELSIRGSKTTINSSYGKARIYYDQESRMIKMD